MRFLTELLSQGGTAKYYPAVLGKWLYPEFPHSIVDANLEVFKSGLYDDKTCQTIGWELLLDKYLGYQFNFILNT